MRIEGFYIDVDFTDKQIAIFGAGENGRILYEKIKKQCKVELFIDNFVKGSCDNIRILSLQEYVSSQYEVDYVLIGSVSVESQKNMAKLLTDCGIEETKLVFPKVCYNTDFETAYEVENLMDSLDKFVEVMRDYKYKVLSEKKYWDYLKYYGDYLILNLTEEQKSLFLDKYDAYAECEESWFCLVWNLVLHRFKLYTPKRFQQYMKKLYEIPKEFNDWKAVRIFSAFEEIFSNNEIIYPEFYRDRYRILDQLSKAYGEECKMLMPESESGKIAITVFWLPKAEIIAHGIIVSQIANGLVKAGYQVKVFVENHNYDKLTDGLIPVYRYLQNRCEEDAHIHKKMFHEKVEVYYNQGDSFQQRYSNYIREIYEYKPECILDMEDEHSFSSHLLAEYYKIYYIPIRGNLGTSFRFDKYFTMLDDTKEMNEKYHFLQDEQVVRIPLGVVAPKFNKIYTRQELNLKEDDFVIVTVGDRLTLEVTEELEEIMCKYLEQNSHWRWLLVGRIRIDIRSVWMKDMIRTGKIICHGYEECLTSLYEICDVYLNPMRAGGGWSVAWAIMKGVLVATTKGINPGNAWIGEKKAIEGNYQDLLEYIDKLDKDRNFYKEEKQYILERSLQLSFDNSVRAIVEEIQKIRI